MNGKRKGLGKGLDALLGVSQENASAEEISGVQLDAGLRELPIEWLVRGRYQPRQDMNEEALQELASSIREQGIMQPILVRHLEHNSYEIVAGERRWRAAQLAGLSMVPALVRDLSDQETLAMALVENIQRENLNAMEESRALARLQDEFGYTQEQVAKAVGKSRSAVANLMRLNTLQKDVAMMLERGDLEMGHGRALLPLQGQQQIETGRMVADKGLSVRDTEALVRRTLKHKEPRGVATASDPDVARVEQRVSVLLGAAVKIQHRTGGKGKMTINYNSVEELEGILEHIK